MAPLQVFEKIIDIQPDDVRGGHVNYARYFAYIGETFAAWYDAMGLDEKATAQTGPLMAHMELNFLRETSYPGRVLCRLSVVRLGRSSLEHSIELCDADRPELMCGHGRAVNVWFDRDLGRTNPWPAEVAARCWAADRS